MRKGQTVKFRHHTNWRNGKYVRKVGKDIIVVKPHDFSDDTLNVSTNDVKPYESLDDEKVIQYGRENIGKLIETIKKALTALMPQFVDSVKQDDKEPHVILYNGGITVEPVAVEVESINGFKDFCGWSVTVWHDIPATRDDPPDVTDAHVGNARSVHSAAALACDTLYKCHANDYWTAEGEAAMFAEWERDEADPDKWPCPDGPNCNDPECAKLKKEMDK